MPDIEFVMEESSCLFEVLLDKYIKLQSSFDNSISLLLDTSLESLEMTIKNG
jgi:hypothetical protein